MKQYTGLFILALFLSCQHRQPPNDIVIEGHVRNVPNGKVYLTEAHAWNVFLDSATATNGHFIFRIKPDASFDPYAASICFPDSTAPSKIRQLFYANEFDLPKGQSKNRYNYNAAFYLEKGFTQIYDEDSTSTSANPHVRIKAGRETALYYKNEVRGFGWLGKQDSVKRMALMERYKKHIKAHPYSYYLLQSLYDAKTQYAVSELQNLLLLFDKEVQQSGLAGKLRAALANRTEPGAPVANLFLLNSNGRQGNIVDNSATVNMLVFWASWCGPCRKEIPLLKDIYTGYAGEGVHMASISMDKNKEQWYKALKQEQMPWTQYVVDSALVEVVQQQYNFNAIPLVIFTDSRGYEIKRFIGNDPNNHNAYKIVIDSVLAQKL